MKRVRFDELVTELARLGCETWQDLTHGNRTRLVRLFFEEYGEWGDALFDDMAPVFDAFENHDDADFGLAVRQKMTAYVRPYVEKELRKQTVFKREREEVEAQLDEVDPHWRDRFHDWTLAEQFYAKELAVL